MKSSEDKNKTIDVGFIDDLRVVLKYCEASLDADKIIFKMRKSPMDAIDIGIGRKVHNVLVSISLNGPYIDAIHEITFPLDVIDVALIVSKCEIEKFDGSLRRIVFSSPLVSGGKEEEIHQIRVMFKIDPNQFKTGEVGIDSDDCLVYGLASPTITCESFVNRKMRPRVDIEEIPEQIRNAKSFQNL